MFKKFLLVAFICAGCYLTPHILALVLKLNGAGDFAELFMFWGGMAYMALTQDIRIFE